MQKKPLQDVQLLGQADRCMPFHPYIIEDLLTRRDLVLE
jgi:hypothetical protein